MIDFKTLKDIPYLQGNIAYICAEYEKFCGSPLPELTDELFDYFYETGSRKEYEQLYFARRGAFLTTAIMCFIYGKAEHFKRLIPIINSICNEKTWALPAHMERDTEHPERVIDLFAAETGQALTETCEILGDKLPADVRQRIKSEAARRIAEPFIERSCHWETADNNWAAVCGGAVGMTFLYAFPEKFKLIEERINNAMRSYLSGFGDDGMCDEGLGYWNYGFWYFIGFADLYKSRTGIDLTDDPKVKSIAMCQQNMFLTDNCVISYSDCTRREGYNSGLAHYLKNRYANDIKIIKGEISTGIDHCYRFLPCVRTLMWTDERFVGLKEQTAEESYFENAEWYVNRKNSFAFTAKGGNNGVSHNHNDVGSFIIADNKNQLIADFGSGEYTHDYFGENRYRYLCNSSRGHSVPIIDGTLQYAGSRYKAEVITHTRGVFELDIAKAYGGAVKRLIRKFTVNDGCVTLSDRFEFSDNKKHDITERFVSVIKPEITEGKAVIGNLVLECDLTPVIGGETLQNHSGEPDILYFIDYPAGERFEIKFTFNKIRTTAK